MKKTCFLFGAGVERAYGISGGSDFAINVLGIKNKVMNEAIKEFYNDVISKSDNKEWYTTCKNRTLKKKELLEAALRKKILDEILADSHINNASEIQNKKIYEDKVEERLKELIKDNEKDDEINEEQLAVIENYTSYMGIIDSKFHTPYEMKVYDIFEEKLPNELYFPYIFIQSGIKPIVEERQINEFAKMLKFLQESDRLIIVGFNLNTDDNHINGIIRSYLNSKEVIYLDYDDTGSKERICYRLRLKDSDNLKYIKINQDNAVLIFEELLNQ